MYFICTQVPAAFTFRHCLLWERREREHTVPFYYVTCSLRMAGIEGFMDVLRALAGVGKPDPSLQGMDSLRTLDVSLGSSLQKPWRAGAVEVTGLRQSWWPICHYTPTTVLSAIGNLGTAAKPSFPQPTADPDPSVRCWELEVRPETLVRCLWLSGSLLSILGSHEYPKRGGG